MIRSDAQLKTRLMVGMEIHVELATRTKMWTAAPNVAHPDYYEAEPNSLVDPIVMGMPGVLPVMNGAALEMSAKVGLALGCRIAAFTKWDRKSYYYPDLPKNYQISQYDLPLCAEGLLETPVSDAPDAEVVPVRIIRAHLEEDAGKLLHEAPGGRPIPHSIVDLNRAGTPLLEIVTYPDLVSADHAVMFGQMLRNVCRFLGVSEGIMQRGHMRFEPNINMIIERDGKEYATPIVEIKNLNSFKALHDAIEYEHHRQVEEWLETGRVMGERAKTTRGWDDARGVTTLQRHKEDADEYRYFPDPDLVPVTFTEEQIEQLRAQIPELPHERRQRYVADFGLSPVEARTLTDERDVCLFFESVVEAGVDPRRTAAILLNNLAKRANDRNCLISDLAITREQVATIERMQAEKQISSNGADQLYGLCCEQGAEADPAELAERKGFLQISDDSALDAWIEQVIADPANEKTVADVRGGKDAAVGRLIGNVMKLSRGQANPQLVREKLITTLRS
jgi:aspartyl-tRNA(Asn)/glutamyl-tRNA(Gln) amidotransferase subunit B